jgi:signal transduction histidine kinase/CheY-like chemotaxis protein
MLKALEAARTEALSERNRLTAVMETLPVGVCIVDARGGTVRTNPAYRELWGGPLPPVRGVSDYVAYRACWAATGKPVQPQEWASARAIRSGETVVNQELQIQRFDGTVAYVLNSAAPIRDADGHIAACAVAVRDITDHKQAEEWNRQLELQVQQAQKQESLGVMAGGIAHDFNNWLSVIIGNIGLVAGSLPADSPGRLLLGKAEEASRHAADLCQQMLAYVGKSQSAFCPLHLNRLLRDMTRLMAASLSKHARLRWSLADRLPLVQGDPNQIRQIVMSLLVNAAEAIGNEPGEITLATGSAPRTALDLQSFCVQEPLPPGEYVFLEVTDTGGGIEDSVLPRVFEPFFSTKFTGRGLGLAAGLGIVRSHHGTIQVQSTPGRGSTFRVWLPAVAGELSASEPPARPARDWRGSGTILVVDDEEAIRFTLQAMLELLGFETVTAADGLEAVEIYRDNPDRFWCVLLDATMPNLDGEATFRELVGIRENVHVVLSSGYTRNDIMTRFAGRGLSGFLQKPYKLEDLSAVLQGL